MYVSEKKFSQYCGDKPLRVYGLMVLSYAFFIFLLADSDLVVWRNILKREASPEIGGKLVLKQRVTKNFYHNVCHINHIHN